MPENRVAGLQRRQVDRHVGLRAGVRLHVGVLGAEERLRAVDRELSRPGRRTRSRRSSACPDSPRRTCWSGPSPAPRARRARRSSPTRSAPGSGSGAAPPPRSSARRRDPTAARSRSRNGLGRQAGRRGAVHSGSRVPLIRRRAPGIPCRRSCPSSRRCGRRSRDRTRAAADSASAISAFDVAQRDLAKEARCRARRGEPREHVVRKEARVVARRRGRVPAMTRRAWPSCRETGNEWMMWR